MNKNYQLKQTWDDKFNETNFQRYEWIESDAVAYTKIILPQLPQDKQCQILQLGCGTSHLSERMHKAGYTNITCVDFSKRLIKKKQKNTQIKYLLADFTEKWKFQQQTKYDLIIDKGSIDCVFCDEDYLKRVLICVNQCYGRLKSGGKLVSFSLGLPKNRVYWFRNKLAPFQEVQVRKQVNKDREELRKRGKNYNKDKQNNSQDYYVYICRKGEGQKEYRDEQQNNNMSGVNFNDNEDDTHQQEERDQQINQQQHVIKQSKKKKTKINRIQDQQQCQNQQQKCEDEQKNDNNEQQNQKEYQQEQQKSQAQQNNNKNDDQSNNNQQQQQQQQQEEDNYQNQFDQIDDN